MTRSVLVTGGAGFIGSHLSRLLISKNCHVVILDALTYAGNLDNISDITTSEHCTFVQGDIADKALVSNLLETHAIDAVLHLAAESHVDNSITASAPFIHTNIEGTYVLLEACRQYWQELTDNRRQDFRFIHVSTDEVYGSLELGGKTRFNEETPYSPRSPYSSSKAASDHLAHAWHHTYGLPVIVTHCSNNFGPNQYPEKLIPFFILQALEGKPLPVYGDGKNVRDWIYVEDHCYGLYLALTKGKPGEVYDFGGDNEYANIDLVQLLCKTLDRLIPLEGSQCYDQYISFVKDRLGHDRRYAIDSHKAKTQLGFTHQSSFEDAFEKTIAWYIEYFQSKHSSEQAHA